MKKIFSGIVAVMMLTSFSVYASGGKNAKAKHAAKKECGKDCPKTATCH